MSKLRRGTLGAALALGAWLLGAPSNLPGQTAPVDFQTQIEPIFATHCAGCHGAAVQLSGLRLDDAAAALRGGYSGAVILPGDAAGSRLIRLVAGLDEKVVMPPAGARLSDQEIALLSAWIDQGASWPRPASAPATQARPKSTHWAFQPITRPEPPPTRDAAWPRGAIDRFILARLESEGVRPSPEADRATLIRRLSFDLTGLPPAPAELERFLADDGPEAYESLVDRLLASPRFGERWARLWLDLARYADSDGYRADQFRPMAARWRRWVIEAINRDMPFDQFTIEQIAGDLLPQPTDDQLVATGFHRHTLTNHEGGTDPEQFRVEQVHDRVNTVGVVWLGLTVGCAQCHDHKYDPISQKEYYQLYDFFNEMEEVDIDAPLPGELEPYAAARPRYLAERAELLDRYGVPARMAEWEQGLFEAADDPGVHPDWDIAFDDLRTALDHGERILRTPADQRSWKRQKSFVDYFVRNYHRVIDKDTAKALDYEGLAKKLAELDEKYPQLTEAAVIRRDSIPRPTHIHVRGQYRDLGIPVHAATPAVLHPLDSAQPTRLDLARWLVDDANPLTARVAVNRYWQELFGAGLATTSDNFGTQGEPPSHPELLDWLATEFRDKGWSPKRLIKTIALSAAYRQSSLPRPELRESDAANRLLARQNRFRLAAEQIRDAALFSGGLLSPEIGGPSVRTGPSDRRSDELSPEPNNGGAALRTRTLYLAYMRMAPHPYLTNFDMPSAYGPACRRGRSNTPLQALNLLNDPTFVVAGQALALRVLASEGGERQRAQSLFRHALARDAQPAELDQILSGVERYRTILQGAPEDAARLAPAAAEGQSTLETAVWTVAAGALLNTEEFLTRQ